MVCEECSVLSTHFRIVYGLNTFFFFGRDLFFFGLNVIKKKTQLKGTFCHDGVLSYSKATINCCLITPFSFLCAQLITGKDFYFWIHNVLLCFLSRYQGAPHGEGDGREGLLHH